MRADRDSSFFSDLDAPETPRTAMSRRDIRRRAARRRNRIVTVLVAPVALAGAFYGGFSVLGGGADDAAQIVSAPLDDDANAQSADAAASPTSKVPGPKVSSATPKTVRTTTDGASREQVRTPAPTKSTTSKAAAKPSTSTTTKTTRKPAPSTTKTTTAAGSGTTNNAAEAEVLRLVNVERGKVGCKPVTADATLTTVARAHSKDMAVKGYFSHDTPGGKDPFERMSDAGYKYSWAAENIAAGQSDAAAVMDSWMNSKGHKANILNCKLTELGVGMWKQSGSQYGVYWTQDFGTPR
ncbi:CAP domain-containing protein [Kineosporia sp. R_H_3]|uniref:CAP domain-containing protein n=1 Tax=Kineosporia sp. R_H_3 TaxID=1961848 RepID=UPI0011798A51|nr:CAP domain-containing protein [Kineosporia sp. R_H_3]